MIIFKIIIAAAAFSQVNGPLRVDSVVPLAGETHAVDPDVIWSDDFDGPEKAYTESAGGVDDHVGFSGSGRSMVCLYRRGEQGIATRKVFFGDSPTGRVVRSRETFEEIYWRVYVKHQPGWAGGGEAKLSRITSIVSPRWNQAMIGHVWSNGETLTLDPASGVRNDRVVTTKYNDFARLHWLGNRPAAHLAVSSSAESGWWICIEARVKLNTPGLHDGLMQLWIDGRLECERTGLDWRGAYTGHGLNAVFLEAYWNEGSPQTQTRWLDNFVISTRPIGPIVAPRQPTLLLGGQDGDRARTGWQAEVAGSDSVVVWQSKPVAQSDRITVNAAGGTFVGPLADRDRLAANATVYCRVRRIDPAGKALAWSHWHQAFRTAAK